MKSMLLAAILCLTAVNAWADGSTCTSQVSDKKLAGAAKTSFLKKCQSDAAATCTGAAVDKKLAGAAKTSFVKKCTSDAVGS
jgi:hypothetical protein